MIIIKLYYKVINRLNEKEIFENQNICEGIVHQPKKPKSINILLESDHTWPTWARLTCL